MIYEYIRSCQLKKLFFPIGLLLFCILLIWWMPLKNQLFPASYSLEKDLNELVDAGASYVHLKADALYDTGCDYEKNGRVAGRYYYSLVDDTCQFFLLGLGANGQAEVLEDVALTGKILHSSDMYEKLLSHTASSIGWTEEGLRKLSSPYVITTLHYVTSLDILLYIVLVVSIAFSAAGIYSMLLYYFHPEKAAAFSHLSQYPGEHSMALVEAEIKERVLDQAGPFYVTEHYVIVLDDSETKILPLAAVLWLYRHSSFFKLSRHRHPTYYLTFMDCYGKFYECASKNKEDTTAVIRAIRKLRPDLLIGYTAENQEEAEKRIVSHV